MRRSYALAWIAAAASVPLALATARAQRSANTHESARGEGTAGPVAVVEDIGPAARLDRAREGERIESHRSPRLDEGREGERIDGPWSGERSARREASAACPDGMILVDGQFCPRVEQRCLRWMDPPGRFHEYRCAEYARPARCAAPRVHSRFCIDRRERAEASGDLPRNMQSWTDAKQACEAAGARVCLESEWTFACEGEEMRPYPYGWSRQPEACNGDHTDLLVPEDHRRLRDERAPVGSHPACVSPFGALDMAGNVAEWVSVDGFPAGSVVVQKGNWWQPGKQACRDSQPGHDRHYKGTETGFRCCSDAR